MKKTILAALLLVASAAVWFGCGKDEENGPSYTEDYGSITGVVTDFSTGEPVKNANVSLRPGGETTLTGSDGTYEFKNLPDGKYSITVSKAEYTDLIDDYVIEVKRGKTMRRDVQIQKKMAVLQIKDMEGNAISSLDFGMEESVTSISFNIFNSGTLSVDCNLSYNCTWIAQVNPASPKVNIGQTVAVTVTIDRTKLSPGENKTKLLITSNNGNNELQITAKKYDDSTPVGYVDLGLTSGTKWKKTNSGIYSYGDAISNFGDALPTMEQWEELKAECQWKWTTVNTDKGYTVTGPNGNSIFLPAAGFRYCDGGTSNVGSNGSYWSSTPSSSVGAWGLDFYSSSVYMGSYSRCYGFSVRLVQD